MKNSSLFIFACMVLFAVGCVPSLNPLYNQKDLVFKKDLIGTWVESKSKETWTFKQKSELEFWLYHSENDEVAVFEAHLVKLKEMLFLNLYPGELKSSNYLYTNHLYPVHSFSLIRISKDQLVIKILDPTWLEESISNQSVEISHVKSADETILLTAQTDELQQFVLDYAQHSAAFKDSLILYRK